MAIYRDGWQFWQCPECKDKTVDIYSGAWIKTETQRIDFCRCLSCKTEYTVFSKWHDVIDLVACKQVTGWINNISIEITNNSAILEAINE